MLARLSVSVRERRPRVSVSPSDSLRARDVQLGVLLHEALHIRLAICRLQNNYRASLDVAAREGARDLSGMTQDSVNFAWIRQRVAHGLLNLVTEIGVDKFMATTFTWVSSTYWHARFRNFYLNAWLLADEDVTTSMRPYLAFYRLVALELGLLTLRDEANREQLLARRAEYMAGLASTCDGATVQWLTEACVKALAFDPIATSGPDPDSYNEVCERVLTLTA
jgi:hypothetical protein